MYWTADRCVDIVLEAGPHVLDGREVSGHRTGGWSSCTGRQRGEWTSYWRLVLVYWTVER